MFSSGLSPGANKQGIYQSREATKTYLISTDGEIVVLTGTVDASEGLLVVESLEAVLVGSLDIALSGRGNTLFRISMVRRFWSVASTDSV